MSSRLQAAVQDAALGPAEQTADGFWRQTFRFAPEFCGFAGHFPGAPVLPAIVQVLLVEELARAMASGPVRLSRVVAAKFLIKLGPGREITVTARQHPNDRGSGLDAQVLCNEGVAAKLRLEFEIEDTTHA